jgi:hypothetical protein
MCSRSQALQAVSAEGSDPVARGKRLAYPSRALRPYLNRTSALSDPHDVISPTQTTTSQPDTESCGSTKHVSRPPPPITMSVPEPS